jgi:hypothetical protein
MWPGVWLGLVVNGSSTSGPRCTYSSDVVPAPGFWGAMGLSTEKACSRVVGVKRLLREVMATVSRDVLHLIWVSLKEKESLCESLWLTLSSLILLCFCFNGAWLKALLTCLDRRWR